jgi:hypothetical protein
MSTKLPNIIHVTGVQCSGKTTLVREFTESDDCEAFDIFKFYTQAKCIKKDGNMDWDRWKETEAFMPGTVATFILRNLDKKVLFIESTGLNRRLNTFLMSLPWDEDKMHKVTLKTPDIKITTERAKATGKNIQQVLDLRRVYLRREGDNNAVSSKGARVYIESIIEKASTQ